MKRVLLTAIGGLLLAATSHAQLSKGQKMLGGELSFTSSENKNEFFLGEVNETSATITPQIGFGLGDKAGVFGQLDLAA